MYNKFEEDFKFNSNVDWWFISALIFNILFIELVCSHGKSTFSCFLYCQLYKISIIFVSIKMPELVRSPSFIKIFLNKILTLVFNCLHHLQILKSWSVIKREFEIGLYWCPFKNWLKIFPILYILLCVFPLICLVSSFLKRLHPFPPALEYAMELNVAGPGSETISQTIS